MKGVVFTALMTAVLALAPAAHGDPVPPAATGTKGDEDPAERLLAEGRALFQKGKSEAALEKLRAAWQLKKTFTIAANLGTAELDMGKMRDAAEHFDFALRAMPDPVTEKDKAKREQLAGQAQQARAAVTALRLQIEPAGAACSLDGSPLGNAPVESELFVEPGSHTLVVKLEGYVPRTQVLEATAGTIHAVSLQLQPEPRPAPPPAPAPRPPPEDRTAETMLWGMIGAGTLASGVYYVAVGADARAKHPDADAPAVFIGVGAAMAAIGLATGIGGILYERRAASTTVSLRVAPELRWGGAAVKLSLGF